MSPFGQMPINIARSLFRNQYRPLIEGLGFQGGHGPLADYIKQVQGFAPSVAGQAQNVGNQVAQEGQQSYNQLKDMVSQYTKNAFDPIRESALFQQTANNVLDPLRASQAARGLESSGAGQAQEQNILQQLGLSSAQNQLSNQQSAIGAQQGQLQSIGQLGQYLSAKFGIPMEALQSLLGLLQGGAQGGLQLGQLTAPQLGQTSSSHKGLGALFTG